MQPDQRIEYEQTRLAYLNGVGQPFRSIGASSRSVGAVITSTGRDWKSTSAAEQIPSKRRRTTARESSAGKSSTGPVRRTSKRRRQGVPEATLTARSRARKLLQHLGSPPRMPTAWSDHSPWTSHWVSEPESIESSLARWTGSWFMSVWGSAWGPGKKPRRRAFHQSVRVPGEARQPTDHWPCSRAGAGCRRHARRGSAKAAGS